MWICCAVFKRDFFLYRNRLISKWIDSFQRSRSIICTWILQLLSGSTKNMAQNLLRGNNFNWFKREKKEYFLSILRLHHRQWSNQPLLAFQFSAKFHNKFTITRHLCNFMWAFRTLSEKISEIYNRIFLSSWSKNEIFGFYSSSHLKISWEDYLESRYVKIDQKQIVNCEKRLIENHFNHHTKRPTISSLL